MSSLEDLGLRPSVLQSLLLCTLASCGSTTKQNKNKQDKNKPTNHQKVVAYSRGSKPPFHQEWACPARPVTAACSFTTGSNGALFPPQYTAWHLPLCLLACARAFYKKYTSQLRGLCLALCWSLSVVLSFSCSSIFYFASVPHRGFLFSL